MIVKEHSEEWGKTHKVCMTPEQRIQQLEALNKKLVEALDKIRLHELGCKRRNIGYDRDVHHWAWTALDTAKKAKVTL